MKLKFLQFFRKKSRGTGKSTWEIIRLLMQAQSDSVLYVVPALLLNTVCSQFKIPVLAALLLKLGLSKILKIDLDLALKNIKIISDTDPKLEEVIAMYQPTEVVYSSEFLHLDDYSQLC